MKISFKGYLYRRALEMLPTLLMIEEQRKTRRRITFLIITIIIMRLGLGIYFYE